MKPPEPRRGQAGYHRCRGFPHLPHLRGTHGRTPARAEPPFEARTSLVLTSALDQRAETGGPSSVRGSPAGWTSTHPERRRPSGVVSLLSVNDRSRTPPPRFSEGQRFLGSGCNATRVPANVTLTGVRGRCAALMRVGYERTSARRWRCAVVGGAVVRGRRGAVAASLTRCSPAASGVSCARWNFFEHRRGEHPRCRCRASCAGTAARLASRAARPRGGVRRARRPR